MIMLKIVCTSSIQILSAYSETSLLRITVHLPAQLLDKGEISTKLLSFLR